LPACMTLIFILMNINVVMWTARTWWGLIW
jgi:hypothetical protein